MYPKKRGYCWNRECQKKVKVEIKLRVYSKSGSGFEEWEIKACAEHFKISAEKYYIPRITEFCKEEGEK